MTWPLLRQETAQRIEKDGLDVPISRSRSGGWDATVGWVVRPNLRPRSHRSWVQCSVWLCGTVSENMWEPWNDIIMMYVRVFVCHLNSCCSKSCSTLIAVCLRCWFFGPRVADHPKDWSRSEVHLAMVGHSFPSFLQNQTAAWCHPGLYGPDWQNSWVLTMFGGDGSLGSDLRGKKLASSHLRTGRVAWACSSKLRELIAWVAHGSTIWGKLVWKVWKQSFWTAISFWSFHVRNESPVQETAQDTLKTVVLSEWPWIVFVAASSLPGIFHPFLPSLC